MCPTTVYDVGVDKVEPPSDEELAVSSPVRRRSIYALTNKTDGKRYIGQTKKDPRARLAEHKNGASPDGTLIAQAIYSTGIDNFELTILSQCDSKLRADDLERYWVLKLSTMTPHGYNKQMPRRAAAPRVQLPVRVAPDVAAELRREARSQFGKESMAGRLIEEKFMKSRDFNPTRQQVDDPLLRACWMDHYTEADTIERCRAELAELRKQLQERDAEISQLRGER